MDSYKNLIGYAGQALSNLGFTKTGNTLYIRKNDNWGLINFQKSRSNLADEIKFTINIGVCSEAIREFTEGKKSTKPVLEDCHWKNRVGFLLPEREDTWWTLQPDTNLSGLQSTVHAALINYCAPEVDRYISNESLEKLWLQGISGWTGELQRFIYLTTLLKIYNKPNLAAIAAELRDFAADKPFEEVARKHLRRLNVAV